MFVATELDIFRCSFIKTNEKKDAKLCTVPAISYQIVKRYRFIYKLTSYVQGV
jgi:hypothetical protein